MKPVKFYLVTDTHYFENELGAEGKAFEKNMETEQYFVRESSAIVKSTFARISEDKETDIVIIPGDLTKNGENESHKSFIKELYKLKESGKKIFVITAGHDYGEFSYAYRNDERIQVEGTDFNALCDMYRDFGYGDAIALDAPTHSYVAEVADGVRMLAICCDSLDQPKGAMDERLMSWAKEQLDKAKADNCSVFAICHYPIIPSVPVFDLVGDAKIKEWRKVAAFLADNGVELILTGHMHIQSINEFYSEKGNRLIDVCTACLAGSPAKYRKVTIDQNSVLKIKTIDVVAYLRDREIHPGKYSPADGYYIDKTRKNHVYPYGRITEASLAIGREYFANLLFSFPDVLFPNQVSEFTGYNKTTVNNWCSKQYLRCFLIRNRYHIPKEYLLDFLISKHFYGIRFKSEKHIAYNKTLAENFKKAHRRIAE